MQGTAVHPFTAAGLGLAPFAIIGFEGAADRAAINAERAANGQQFTSNNCGGSCDYCGMAIFNVFTVRSADGQEFKVGSDCVKKCGDAKLVKVVDEQLRAASKARKRSREQAVRDELKSLIAANTGKLMHQPHPNKGMADNGRTLYDYATTTPTAATDQQSTAATPAHATRAKPSWTGSSKRR